MTEKDTEVENLLDNMDFRPITEGLGFHHSLKEKKQIKTNLNQQSEALKNEFELRAKELVRETDENDAKPSPIHRGDLTPFYEKRVEDVKVPIESLKLDQKELSSSTLAAGPFIRFGAWFIDIAILVVSMTITFASIVYFAELPVKMLNSLIITGEIVSSLACIGLSFYIFYFAVLDKTEYSTVGKNILGLKVISLEQKNMSLYRSFLRTLLSIVGMIFLGLPIILDIHSKLTETKVTYK